MPTCGRKKSSAALANKMAIPPERKRQFALIAAAADSTLKWAHQQGIPLEHIEPVVPCVETDFSLEAWLFLDTEEHIRQFRLNGTIERLAARFRLDLADSGYPAAWTSLVECHFGSKEVVDRDFKGRYYYFLR